MTNKDYWVKSVRGWKQRIAFAVCLYFTYVVLFTIIGGTIMGVLIPILALWSITSAWEGYEFAVKCLKEA